MKRQFKPFKCSICNKMFKLKEEDGIWCMREDEFICPKCMDKWYKEYEIKDVKFIPPNENCIYTKADVTFKNGRIEQFTLGVPLSYNADMPDEFWDELSIYVKEYQEEEHKKEISVFDIVDTFDEQRLHIETYGGYSIDIKFRYGRSGEYIFDTKTAEKLPSYLIPQINKKLRERV